MYSRADFYVYNRYSSREEKEEKKMNKKKRKQQQEELERQLNENREEISILKKKSIKSTLATIFLFFSV